jgi:hypothetical protein
MAVDASNGRDLYSQTKYNQKLDDLVLLRNENQLTGRKRRGQEKNSVTSDKLITNALENLDLDLDLAAKKKK